MGKRGGKVQVLKGRSGTHEHLKEVDHKKYETNYVKMFGETCYTCRKNTKQKNEDGDYVCPHCNKIIKTKE